jgi:chromosome segregation ATPase
MSKSETTQKAVPTAQLKKDLSQAVKILQNLTNGIEKIDSSLIDSEAARAAEHRYNERVSRTQQEITDLRERYRILDDERQKEIVLFATANLKLVQEFEARLRQKDQEHKAKLNDAQKLATAQEQRWKQKLDAEKAEYNRLKENENSSRRQREATLKECSESWGKLENSLINKLKELEKHVVVLSDKNKSLMEDLDEHQVMKKGRETEISRLGNRLSALEAFAPDSPDQYVTWVFCSQKP